MNIIKDTLEYDIVIIGSGAGGGTVAKELAELCEKGQKIALLEWGGEFRDTDNIREEIPMVKKYYFDFGGTQNKQQDITYAFAKAVGGSTTVYTGTSLRAPAKVFEKWGVDGLDIDDMNPRYEKYIKENNVHLNDASQINENNTLFEKGCKELGWHVEQFPVNTRNCQGLGTCNLGCAVSAKQGTNIVQIPEARSHGVEVFPFTKALKIEGHDIFCEVIPPEHNLDACQLEAGKYIFQAKRIVIAAGAVNSPALLMRSFGKDFLPAIGRYFTCHPALILVADHGREIDNIKGHPKSFYSEEFMDSHHFLLETCMYFPFVLSKNLNGYGEEMDSLMDNFKNLQMILTLVSDSPYAHNRITIDGNGEPVIDYELNDENIQAFVDSIRAATKIFFKVGAKRVHAPAMNKFFITKEEEGKIDELIHKKYFKRGKISIAAGHLMGGCRMGADTKTSVTNAWGKVHGFDHIYVADASLFPGASEVNPYLTVMSLADRVAEGIKAEIHTNN